jgi:hypothetical protein
MFTIRSTSFEQIDVPVHPRTINYISEVVLRCGANLKYLLNIIMSYVLRFLQVMSDSRLQQEHE